MKIFYFIPALFLFACSVSQTSNDASSENFAAPDLKSEGQMEMPGASTKPGEESEIPVYDGEITMNNKGCTQLITIDNGGGEVLLYPINLEEKFMKNGKQVQFSYQTVRNEIPAGCKAAKAIKILTIN